MRFPASAMRLNPDRLWHLPRPHLGLTHACQTPDARCVTIDSSSNHFKRPALITNDLQQTPSRSLGLQGASNFRDLGGYLGADGKRVVWRKLFRSDNLARLTQADVDTVQGLDVRRSYDFRGVQERAATPYTVNGLTQHSLSIEPTVVQRMQDMLASGNTITPPIAVSLMQETYRGFAQHNADRFAALFHAMLSSDDPLVFHCTAGKDRTGFAAALILHTLGVSQADIMADYLLTNTLYKRPDTPVSTTTPIEALRVIWKVQAEYLQASMDTAHAEWGDTDTYLAKALGIGQREKEALRARYLA